MRRIVFSVIAMALVLGFAGYSAGFFTGEERKEESCILCRATRYTGRQYGFPYQRIEDSVLTRWYREHLDPEHGRGSAHPHIWQQSACTVKAGPGAANWDYACPSVAPVFLLRPEIETAILEKIKNRETQMGLIQSLQVSDRRLVMQRIRYLIEYYYIDQETISWDLWWQKRAVEFGMTAK